MSELAKALKEIVIGRGVGYCDWCGAFISALLQSQIPYLQSPNGSVACKPCIERANADMQRVKPAGPVPGGAVQS